MIPKGDVMHWEYCFETGKFEELEDFTDRLNAVGREGWEAVGMSENDDDFTVLLRRTSKAAVGAGESVVLRPPA
jgi:hypothetical protein